MSHFFVDSNGERHWGRFGAAGLLISCTEHDVKHYLVQLRARNCQRAGTWSIPGGALREGETPLSGAVREGEEEGVTLPPFAKIRDCWAISWGVPPQSWTYYTFMVTVEERFAVKPSWEWAGYAWVTLHEMGTLNLHPHFRYAAEVFLGLKENEVRK